MCKLLKEMFGVLTWGRVWLRAASHEPAESWAGAGMRQPRL